MSKVMQSIKKLEETWHDIRDNELYEYFKSNGTSDDDIEKRYGKDTLDGYIHWFSSN